MNKTKRMAVYLLGMTSLALGIIINAKTGLGVSPLVSVAFCISKVWATDFANTCMAMYTVFFLLEEAVKLRRAKWFDILQLPFCWVFTRLLSLFSAALPQAPNMAVGVALMVPAVLFTGLGVVLMVDMRMLPNPSDGFVQAVSDRTGLQMGLVKNILDLSCVAVTLAIGLLSGHRVIGIGLGTLIAMVFNGRAVALFQKLFGKQLNNIYTRAVEKKAAEE